MGDVTLEDMLDDIMKATPHQVDNHTAKHVVDDEVDNHTAKHVVDDEEKIVVEELDEVEASPFVEDDILPPVNGGTPTSPFDSSSLKDGYTSLSLEIKKTIDEYLRENNVLYSLKYEIDNNKILIQDLKSSVVSLKVATSQIEKEVREISSGIGSISKEKKQLDNSLIDLEFRFNELVTRQEEGDMNNNSPSPVSTVDQSSTQSQSLNDEQLQTTIREVVENLETKIKELDQRIVTIDDQNRRIVTLSNDIAKHEKHVTEIKQTLNYHAEDLTKLDNLTKKVERRNDTLTILQQEQQQPADNNFLVQKVDEFIAKTELNEKSIATAWVGLIAALLLIPIAYFLGKVL